MLNQLLRYSGVVPLIAELGRGRLLDVGSGSESIAPRLGPGWTVTAVDRSFDDYGTAAGPSGNAAEHVVADAADLPFADRSFDVVLALDVLEHVPPQRRAAVLGEIARVAARRAIVACPAGAAALAADRRLADRYRRAGRPLPGWLQEHLDNGFPEPHELVAALAPFGRVTLRRNENARFHERLMATERRPRAGVLAWHLSRVLAPAGRDAGAASALARPLVGALRGFDRSPAYRAVAVLDRS